MPFDPRPNDILTIDGMAYRVAEHPAAPGVAYGQEGRAGIVYQLLGPDGEAHALKVFKPRFRMPGLVSLSGKLAAFADLPSLQVCRRVVLTSRKYGELLREHPDLAYAVLMPWMSGPTWMQVIVEQQALTPEQSLRLARALLQTLAEMEERSFAHCDLSGPNVILPGLVSSETTVPIALVDVEQMYAPDLNKPEILPGGSAGYAHKTAPEGLWSASADRFAGAVLLAEMLGWCDARARDTVGESYFAPNEMQTDCPRYRRLRDILRERWGERVAHLFERAWHSDTLSDCPTFDEWLVALPESVPAAPVRVDMETERSKESPVDRVASVRTLIDLARQFEVQGNRVSAAQVYQQALALTPAGGLRDEIALILRDLEKQAEKPRTTDNELASLFDDGLAAYHRGDWASAHELLSGVTRRQPDYARAGKRAVTLLAEAENQLVNRQQRGLPGWAWTLIMLSVVGLVGLSVIGLGATGIWVVNSIVASNPTSTPKLSSTQTATTGPGPTPMPTKAPSVTSLPSPTTSSDPELTPIDTAALAAHCPLSTSSQLVFSSARDFANSQGANFEIYKMNADGSTVQRLTYNSVYDGSPSWSPEGSAIAFESYLAGNSDIYVMSPGGGNLTQLTFSSADDFVPVWSSNGARIAFYSQRDGNYEIYVMNSDGSNQVNLTNNPDDDRLPTWSPDGQQIAFTSNRGGNYNIYTMNSDGSNQIQITNNRNEDRDPAWSPSGFQIAFETERDGNSEIYTMNTDGSSQSNLTQNPADDSTVAWSADGTRLSFESERDGNIEVYVMNADGSCQTRLTFSPRIDNYAAWSP